MNLILDGLWEIWCGDNSDVRGSMLALMLNKPSLNYGSCIMNTGVLTLGDVDTVGRIAVAINWWRRLGRGWLTNGPPTIPPVRCLDHNNRSNIMDLTPTTDNTISFFTHNKHTPGTWESSKTCTLLLHLCVRDSCILWIWPNLIFSSSMKSHW